jgi:hypothetical protein
MHLSGYSESFSAIQFAIKPFQSLRSKLNPKPPWRLRLQRAGRTTSLDQFMEKSMTRIMTLLMTIAITTLATLPARADDSETNNHVPWISIAGAWETEVTIRNCQHGAVLAPPFAALNTFHWGGTLSEMGTRASPATRGSGHGTWRRTGRDTFVSSFMFHRFDANGFFTGSQRVQRIAKVAADSQSFTAEATLVIVDAQGVLIARGCATETGTRIKFD